MPTVKGRSHHARMCSPMQCEQPLMWITGANFHRAMVATAAGEKLLRALSCEELDPALICFLCFIAFVQKITFFLGKSTKTVATRAALFDSDTPNRLPAGVSLRTCPLPSSPAPSDHVSSSAAVLDNVSTSGHFCASTTTSSSCVAYWFFITHSLFHSKLKTFFFSANPSHCSLSFSSSGLTT